LALLLPFAASAQQSVAREWNEALLQAIRKDLARPVVQARNLFHVSVAMYDAWAAYDGEAETYLLGKTVGGYTVPFNGVARPADPAAARREAVSYAAYRVLQHRFRHSPGAAASERLFDSLLTAQGYDTAFTSADYRSGSPAALGNYIARSVIAYGLQDGANEAGAYALRYYRPVNRPLVVSAEGDTTLDDPNRWQPLTLTTFIDQNGNVFPGSTPPFLGAEWGNVTPFALTGADRTTRARDGHDYNVYHDPGPFPQLDTADTFGASSLLYKWGYTLVAAWSSHLGVDDNVLWDISPASVGNAGEPPATFDQYPAFYRLAEGGDAGTGRAVNPRTGLPYTPEIVPRGDYARTLAEFWADGPSSETPPGHWFTILNYVSDHPLFHKRWRGAGPEMDALAWDVKAYLALGGAMHDAAIAAWGVKGWYDGVRPVSVLRWMAGNGQCSDSTLPHYSRFGLPIIPGLIELVGAGDPLAGSHGEFVGKVKLFAWRGHAAVANPATDNAGVGWVLGDAWWPYQRQSFVTPPFAGYISGHSTFSRAAAEVMTALTGDEYFPGGMGEFFAPNNEFLVFENGPSVDVTLEWATYRDAADQCSLSRIWGGIHAPLDDIPGRLVGRTVGAQAFLLAERYVTGQHAAGPPLGTARAPSAFPNPARGGASVNIRFPADAPAATVELFTLLGQRVAAATCGPIREGQTVALATAGLASGVYLLRVTGSAAVAGTQKLFILR
jgi:hypothetical protein